MTRSPQELADLLRRRVPAAVASVEQQHGLYLHDALNRRALPESQALIRSLVLELHSRHWAPIEIARWLDTDERAVRRAITNQKAPSP